MNIEELRTICLSLPFVTEDYPFDNDTLVFKVGGKMFALISLSNPTAVNLKCDPLLAIELREKYNGIKPVYHMNKKHWNTLLLEGDYTDHQLKEWIVLSYQLVYNSLTKK
jgi:predicted DNA-binding protein (MmcQ/YjbR family)